MSASHTADASRDHPDAYIARDRRRALAGSTPIPDRVSGSALFADISGFTPLTETLANELGPQRGAEELTTNIGRVFQAVIDELDGFGGDVIYFSGDAITCWIDGDDGTRACAAALAMQEAIARSGEVVTPSGTRVRLAMKVAVTVGSARRFLVGDPDIQLIDVLAGRLIDELAAAEHHAGKGEVVLAPSAIARLGDAVDLGEVRVDEVTGRRYAVLAGLHVEVSRIPLDEPPPLPDRLVRPWLLPEVYERLRTGRGEFLTELRPAIPLFLNFTGIDYDNDPEAIAKLDDFVRAAQRILTGYGGNLLLITLGDKGAYLYGVFGSPSAHEDDAVRAAAAALDLRELEKTTAARGIRIGITHGRLRSGTYGHPMRRSFACMGDAVNLSARLMTAAPEGGIFVSEPIQTAAGDAFIWERLPDLKLKGKAQAVAAWELKGSMERATRRRVRFALKLVGRRAELAALDGHLAEAAAGQGRIVGIAAEAGLGKSRLIAEFLRVQTHGGRLVAYGECQAFGTNTSYFVWQEIWRRLFGLEDDPEAQQIRRVEAVLAAIDPSLVARAPLLGTVLGLTIPESDLTRSLDAKLRKASLEDLLIVCMRARAAAEPVIIVLEDCQWIDELSGDLLVELGRASAGLRILFVLAYRPARETGGGLRLESLPHFSEIGLGGLDDENARTVVRSKAEQVLGPDVEITDEVAELVARRAEGNPLYIEELVAFIAGQGVDLHDRSAMASIQLPDSLHSLVLGRIDSVREEPRRTLKVASVIGRIFRAPILPGAYPELGSPDRVRTQLDILRTADLVSLERQAEEAWLFKHGVTQEVAYESLPFGMRTMLHGRVGAYLEHEDPEAIERNLDLLAHHFWLGDRDDKKREYLRRAAGGAQAAYANAAAITYFERLIPLLDGDERIAETLHLAEVLQVIGETERAVQIVLPARDAAIALYNRAAVARCDHLLAESLRRLGRFDEAESHLNEAREAFAAMGDDAGLALVLQVGGTVRAQRGDLAGARARYTESLSIRERLGDQAGVAALLNNLGIVAYQRGDLPAARDLGERALALYRQSGDRRRISACENNLVLVDVAAGEYQAALDHCREGIRLAGEVGDRQNLAIAQNNMGDALRDMGRLDDAGMAYAAAAEAFRDLGDRGSLMALMEDVAILGARAGRHSAALTLAGAAGALRKEMGALRSAGAEAALLEKLEASQVAVGTAAAERAEQAGRGLSLDEAIALTITSARELRV